MIKAFKIYWQSYGGFKALFKSPLFYISLFMTLFSYNFISNVNWLETPNNMLPTLLGFNIASYSVWLAFGNQKLNRILSKERKPYSKYIIVNSSFLHFILVQLICLIFTVFLKANSFDEIAVLLNINLKVPFFLHVGKAINLFALFLFYYGLFTMLGAILGFISIATSLDIIYRQEFKLEKIEKQELIKKQKLEQEIKYLEEKKLRIELDITQKENKST